MSTKTALVATPEQIEALSKFAAQNGRTWKSKLNECWMKGNYRDYVFLGGPDPAILQGIRNNLGPSWLARFSWEDVR